MAATYVTIAELRSALGLGQLGSDADLEQTCQAAEDIVKSKLWFNSFPIAGGAIQNGYCYVLVSANPSFVVGQSIVITNCGTKYNGTHTVTSTYPWTQGSSTFPYMAIFPFGAYYTNYPRGYTILQYTASGSPADENYHQILPYGKATGDFLSTPYADVPAVQIASLEIAIDIWQSRQQSNAGGVSPDFSPSPYRMGRSLLTRVEGLLADYKSPAGMVG
jgi:hypothetical protein